MAPKIYEDVIVGTLVYCSSSQDYFVNVRPVGKKGPFQIREYHINAQCILVRNSVIDRPKYLIERIKERLRGKIYLRIFERDRDGLRKYEPLRYGNMDELMEMIQRK